MTITHPIIHHPFNFPVFGFAFTGFGIAVLLAFLLSQIISERELARRGHALDAAAVSDVLFAAVVGTLIGAKLYYVIGGHAPDRGLLQPGRIRLLGRVHRSRGRVRHHHPRSRSGRSGASPTWRESRSPPAIPSAEQGAGPSGTTMASRGLVRWPSRFRTALRHRRSPRSRPTSGCTFRRERTRTRCLSVYPTQLDGGRAGVRDVS